MTAASLSSRLYDLLTPNGASHVVWGNPVLFIAVAAGLVLALTTRYSNSPWRKLPPGPPGLPLIGNALQLKDEQWFQFSEWRKIYGDIFYLNAAGQPIIVINSHAIATDLLDRRAGKSSDRPLNIVGCEIMTGGLVLSFARYTSVWRRMRKAAHEAVNKVVVQSLDEHLSSEALVLARSGLQDASSWDDHLRRTSANMMLSSLYGERPLGKDDPHMAFISEYNEKITLAVAPGAHWVEMFPWMRYIPSRFASWKRSAEDLNRRANDNFGDLFSRAQKRTINGEGPASFSSTLVQEAGRYGLSARENAWLAASMYGAGSDTSAAAMSWWSLAMLVHPEAQKRAQDELDAVVGHARVPTFADRTQLPYTCAMVREVMRWRPVTPSGVPHRSTEDDFYEGYFIPKGALIIPNVWELSHDEETYGADAHCFNPARYLDVNGQLVPGPSGTKDDGHFSFGFGRRVCVGKHVANNSLFIEIATCLWAFSLVNVEGQDLDVNAFHDEGIIVRPKPFEVNIEPRFPEAIALLSHECELRGR
ncbi:cytochrome P450 [Peniophora sp. CONT]|nr:cytochrome P450 [Peniophora sp. CONT]